MRFALFSNKNVDERPLFNLRALCLKSHKTNIFVRLKKFCYKTITNNAKFTLIENTFRQNIAFCSPPPNPLIY